MELFTAAGKAVLAALDGVDAAWDSLTSLPVDGSGAPEALEVLERLETLRRRLPAVEHAVLAHLQTQATAKEMGAKSWPAVLTARLGISAADARRRIVEAAQVGPRRAVTGEVLAPLLAATAAAVAAGRIGAEHVGVIRDFLAALPAGVDPGTRGSAEAQLAGLGGTLTPEGLRTVARQLMGYLDPDGTVDDEREHARKRGITIGAQELDGMSRLTGWLDPELRAALDAITAKLAAPGYANPADPTPCLDGVPTAGQISADVRTGAQRTHDAIAAVCAAMLASGQLGRHNGLPVTIIVCRELHRNDSHERNTPVNTTTTTEPTTIEQHCAAMHAEAAALEERAKLLSVAGDLEGAVALLRAADMLGVSAHLIRHMRVMAA